MKSQNNLNGHYCIANKLHYNKLVEDGWKASFHTSFNDAKMFVIKNNQILKFSSDSEQVLKQDGYGNYKPMHLHTNEWVFGSLEHEETIALTYDDILNIDKTTSKEEKERDMQYRQANKYKLVERITREEAIGELRQWAEKQCTWIDFYEFSGALDIYLEANQKDNN